MKWYEYKAEVDDLHASEELKARLLAMQTAQAPAPAAPARKKAVYFPLKRCWALRPALGWAFSAAAQSGFLPWASGCGPARLTAPPL